MKHLTPGCIAFILFTLPSVAQQGLGTPDKLPILQPGVVLPRVISTKHPEQSYAIYLPSQYVPEKYWPIVYAFDPGAQGSLPVERMKDSAERYGYIVVGSNNSRNGSWKIEAEAAEAMLQDAQERLAIDRRRVYFAGFSGGARLAAQLAQLCKCATGVLLNGAGFEPEAFVPSDAPFVVFTGVGTYDFNYGEIVRMDDALEKLRYAHFLRRFDGPHQWAPSSAMDEALAWFRLQAMKSGRESRDDSFIAAVAAQEAGRAHAFELSGDRYAAWKEYRQAAEAIVGLTDNASLRSRAETLEKDITVRESVKREAQEFEEQDRITRDISSELSELRRMPANRTDLRADVGQKITDLRGRADHEKHEERLRVLKRALAGVMVQAMEMGFECLDQKQPAIARDYFELACDADPGSVWALRNLAVSRALDGDRKGALQALRSAKSKTKEPGQFAEWLKEEPAFAKLRGMPEFTAILEVSPRR